MRTGTYEGIQGGSFGAGISAQSAGAERLCLHRLVVPAGKRGRPHLHEGHESAILIQSGQVEVWHGPGLAEHVVLRAGDYIHIPADTPHLPVDTGAEDGRPEQGALPQFRRQASRSRGWRGEGGRLVEPFAVLEAVGELSDHAVEELGVCGGVPVCVVVASAPAGALAAGDAGTAEKGG
ncbi:cupin domain-containing protein [Streptomyces yangpuensis]|uniref:cupin domain-containing protein n=1 Tax=Streptomyces yangpuensis TaxID=1648182 RepID=UPI003628E4D5